MKNTKDRNFYQEQRQGPKHLPLRTPKTGKFTKKNTKDGNIFQDERPKNGRFTKKNTKDQSIYQEEHQRPEHLPRTTPRARTFTKNNAKARTFAKKNTTDRNILEVTVNYSQVLVSV